MAVMHVDTPVGRLTVEADETDVVRIGWRAARVTSSTPLLIEAARQIEAYFDRRLTRFDLPLRPHGGSFAQDVYREMMAIPYGETRSYGEIARRLGSHGQPVGQACGGNPIPVIIPCHRVLSAHGLGGYSGAGGVDTKIALLKLEGGYPFLV